MLLSELVNHLHHEVQELENLGANLDYKTTYVVLEDLRNYLELLEDEE
jgi:hypothetical protein